MKKPIHIAIIQYPGTNCEFETAAAVKSAGMTPDIFRWNRPAAELKQFHGFILAGGFSYQDRIRAGAVAAKKSIISQLMQEADLGKPILGICNGAQVLIETGMVPGGAAGRVEMALAANHTGHVKGYYCNWVYIKSEESAQQGCFNRCFQPGQVIPIPIAHAEGRFTTQSPETRSAILTENRIAFRYCRPDGVIDPDFPFNPNGSIENIAGLYNARGNVLALMPHPERAAWKRQVPPDLPNDNSSDPGPENKLQELRKPGPGALIFKSMKEYIEESIDHE